MCVKFHAQILPSLGEISEKPSWKLETWLPPFYKTMNNIKMVFSNYFQKEIQIFNFFQLR